MFPVKWAPDIRGAEQHQEDWNPFQINPADWSFCLLVKELDPVNNAFSFYRHTVISVTQSSATMFFSSLLVFVHTSSWWCGSAGEDWNTITSVVWKDQQHLRVMTIESRVAAAWLNKQEEINSKMDKSVFSCEESRMFSTIQAEVAL